MNNTFAIGIPTINRFDLLHVSLLDYLFDFPNTRIYIMDNGHQGITDKVQHENITVIENDTPECVARCWNRLCTMIYNDGCRFPLIMNDDIYWGRQERQLQIFLENNIDARNYDIYLPEHHEWSAFILPQETYKKIGPFDETFSPAYFEDRDYEKRLGIAGMKILRTNFFDSKVFRNSQSHHKDHSLLDNSLINREYYLKKWGGEPGKETFSHPFGVFPIEKK